jgi:1,4-alpha-glucan branching enzyme
VNNVVVIARHSASGEPLVAVTNFSGRPIDGYRIGMPRVGDWAEVLNTDAAEFGGSGVGNAGRVVAAPDAWAGQPAVAELTLPPLATLWLTPR